MSDDRALIPHASALERALELSAAQGLATIDTDLTQYLDPQRCPLAFLPLLAFERHIYYWDEDWSEDEKRTILAGAPARSRALGATDVMHAYVADVGATLTLLEWWESGANDVPFTAEAEIGGLDTTRTEAASAQARSVEGLLQATKPAHVHLRLRHPYRNNAPIFAAAIGTATERLYTIFD